MILSLLCIASCNEHVDQAREPEGELEAEVLLEVAAEVVAVQVIQNLVCFTSGKNVTGYLKYFNKYLECLYLRIC